MGDQVQGHVWEVPQTLARLAARGLPLAVLSQGTPEMLAAVIRRNHLAGLLAAVVSAGAVHKYKPAPEPYQLLARQLALALEAILFVTAHGWDLAGAAAAGLPTAWLNREAAPPEALGVQPEMELASRSDLVGGA